MAGKGKRVTIHGAFRSKQDAKRKESRVKGSFVKPISVRGQRRYAVIKEK